MKSYLTMCITERNAEKEARRIAEVEARAKAEALAREEAARKQIQLQEERKQRELLARKRKLAFSRNSIQQAVELYKEKAARAGALWDDADITLEIAKEEILSYGEFAELKETEGKVQEQASDIVD